MYSLLITFSKTSPDWILKAATPYTHIVSEPGWFEFRYAAMTDLKEAIERITPIMGNSNGDIVIVPCIAMGDSWQVLAL